MASTSVGFRVNFVRMTLDSSRQCTHIGGDNAHFTQWPHAHLSVLLGGGVKTKAFNALTDLVEMNMFSI